MKKRVLLSVSDKTGIVEFAKEFEALGYEIVSTGGTAKAIRDAGVAVTGISDITGFPECLDGRVKTLHPMVHAGILAMRDNKEHMKQLEELKVVPIDVIAINLYPFKQTILKENVALEDAIENIDIGGPTMIRAAAKNWQDVAVVVDPRDYDSVIAGLKGNGLSKDDKFKLALKVFEHTAAYDALICNYLRSKTDLPILPEKLTKTFEKVQDMRYGENPHQRAAFYREVGHFPGSLVEAKQLHGKELSFNNINDTNGALDALKEFDDICVVGVKHANPCGIGIGDSVYEAYMNAYESDPVSIFGGIIASNTEIDKATAEEINKIFIEIVIAPSFSKEALDVLTQKPNIRLLELPGIATKNDSTMLDMKKVAGGLVVQTIDTELYDGEPRCVTSRQPSKDEMQQLNLAWKAVKHAKSNGIVLARGKGTIGVGPGQTNRIMALEIAIKFAGEKAKGSVLASDAFFPFGDCVQRAHEAGVTAIIQPGGSIRDEESIKLCEEYGIAMVFTGMRHFKH